MRRVVTKLIKGYSYFISPLLPASCRFWPSCSAYTVEAVEKHGVAAGLFLGARRVGRCHPWHPGGADPVPDPKPATVEKI